MKERATVQQRVEAAREVAIERLAFVMKGGDLREQHVRSCVRIALQDYRLRYPECPARCEWLFYDGDPSTKRIKGTPERIDVYCLFCRVMLVNNAVWNFDYSDRVLSHTTICALRSLGGMLMPGAPGTYLLPSDLTEDNMGRRIMK